MILILAPDRLLQHFDQEQDQDHEQEAGDGCALAVAHYNRNAQRP
jgi:hypothetical protein